MQEKSKKSYKKGKKNTKCLHICIIFRNFVMFYAGIRLAANANRKTPANQSNTLKQSKYNEPWIY